MIDPNSDWTLITGATSGIGYEMAKILAADGKNLILVSRNEEKLCKIAREMNEVSDVVIMPYDLSANGAAKIIFDECERLGLRVSTLINNAGSGKYSEAGKMPFKQVESMISLNDIALTSLCHLYGDRMKERGYGYILNVSSSASFIPLPYMSAYSASKAYVRYFSNALRQEYKNYGINVTCLIPAYIHHDFIKPDSNNGNDHYLYPVRKLPARRIAKLGLNAMYKGKKDVITGFHNRMLCLASKFLPAFIMRKLLRQGINQY